MNLFSLQATFSFSHSCYNYILKYSCPLSMAALMNAKVSLGQSGIMVHHTDTAIALDPSRPTDCHFTFVSHAHVDHLHKRSMEKKNKTQVLASKETALIALARGYKIGDPAEHYD